MQVCRLTLVLGLSVLLAGCDPVSLTALGVGASTGVSHTLGGIVYRTFSEPMSRVKSASYKALQRMQVKVKSTDKIEYGEEIKAVAADREISIELEALTPNTTRMRVTATNGIFRDSATATEIIIQTEKYL